MKNAAGKTSTDVFATGSGQVQPKKFFDPGLFVTASTRDWRGFIAGQGLDTGVPALAAQDLNVPSFADSQVAGTTTLTRSFLATKKGTWTPKVYLPGFDVTAVPAVVKSKRIGDVIDVTLHLHPRRRLALDAYAEGAITLSGPTEVRMPVAMKPRLGRRPDLRLRRRHRGSVTVPVTAGDTGAVSITLTGLAGADPDSYGDSIAVGDFSTTAGAWSGRDQDGDLRRRCHRRHGRPGPHGLRGHRL